MVRLQQLWPTVSILSVDGFWFFAHHEPVPQGIYQFEPTILIAHGIPTVRLGQQVVYPGIGTYTPPMMQLGLALGISQQQFLPLKPRQAFRRFMDRIEAPVQVEVV